MQEVFTRLNSCELRKPGNKITGSVMRGKIVSSPRLGPCAESGVLPASAHGCPSMSSSCLRGSLLSSCVQYQMSLSWLDGRTAMLEDRVTRERDFGIWRHGDKLTHAAIHTALSTSPSLPLQLQLPHYKVSILPWNTAKVLVCANMASKDETIIGFRSPVLSSFIEPRPDLFQRSIPSAIPSNSALPLLHVP